jgi:phosphoglycolate phosphatase
MTALTVVFDLDGTLVDTAPDLIDTLNVVFAREGLPPVEYARARNMIGGGARRMIESGLELEGRNASPGDIDRMFGDFIAYYAAHIADRSRPFPGLDDALDRLAAEDCRFAVCTNKLERLSRRLLDALGLSGRFAAICGQDTFGIQKPDPEILRRTIAAAGGDPAQAVMVGDSGTDIDTARAARIPMVAVDFGYSDPPVAQLRPDRLIGHFSDLAAAVRELAGPGRDPVRPSRRP